MQPSIGPSMSRHRRTALSFRDSALPPIFTIAIQTLQQLSSGSINVADKSDERRLTKQVLNLSCNCLSFDFMGTIPDDTSDEQGTVMVPHSWNMLRDDGIPKLFFDMFSRTVVRAQAKVVVSHGHTVPSIPLGGLRRWLPLLPTDELQRDMDRCTVVLPRPGDGWYAPPAGANAGFPWGELTQKGAEQMLQKGAAYGHNSKALWAYGLAEIGGRPGAGQIASRSGGFAAFLLRKVSEREFS
ncbi:unnamed protein product [Effrenium voratum]|nr:unnamed protein product [Effrenium voratum]